MSRASSPLRDRVIILVGARRSGTNWLQRIVGAHPDVVCAPTETHLFSRGIAPLAESFQHGAAGSYELAKFYMERNEFLDALRDFCDRALLGLLRDRADTTSRIAERTPDHCRHLELIGDVYPDARVVHIIRDGRDVARSLASQSWGPDSIAEAAVEWRDSVGMARAAAPRLAHYYEVRYEALLADPATEVRRLYEALGLDVSDQILNAAVIESSVPFNVDEAYPSIGEGKWRHTLSEADVAAIESVAGDLLAELGYGGVAEETARRAAPPPVVAGRWRSLAQRALGRNAGLTSQQRRTLAGIQALVDRFLEAAAGRKVERIEALIAPSALCRVVSSDGEWQGRDDDARRRFAREIAADPAFEGRQIRGDIHSAFPQCTFVGAYADGETVHERVLVLTAAAGQASRLTWYRLPIGRAGRQ